MSHTLLSLGHGYTAQALAPVLLAQGWQIIGTTRDPDRAERFRSEGVEPLLLPAASLTPALERATHILASAAPGPDGDPFLARNRAELLAARPEWVGYLSTTGVYGDHQGGWVDEDTPLKPGTTRGRARVAAEQCWASLGLALHIFRLAGIYGPGRGPFEKVREGSARRIIKPGQVFSRIHVEDIAQALVASMNAPSAGAIYNVCDDDPAPPEDVIAHAAALLGLPEPPAVAFEDADLGPMARSFYSESKRIRNSRMKRDLGVVLRYPTYREGLLALLADQV